MKKHKVLVTGGAGFIGSQLCVRLRDAGYEVLGLDNFNDHLYDPALKYDRVMEFKLDCNVTDLCDIDALRRDMMFFQPDTVIHLAALAGVRDSFGKEREYHRVNIGAVQNLIDVCNEMEDKPRIIYASTSSVYGGTKVLPWVEERVDGHQLNAYDYTKYVNECQFLNSGLFTNGLRFFTVYGPWGRPDMALFKFTKNILDGTAIDVYNYGDMKRDFTYIDDILDGIQIVLKNELPPGEIYNIGRGKQVELMEFINAIEENCGKEANINMKPRHPADTLETWSDTTKLQELGYKPKVDVETGIKNFFDWYKWYNGVN